MGASGVLGASHVLGRSLALDEQRGTSLALDDGAWSEVVGSWPVLVVLAFSLVVLTALVLVALWPWRIEATLKATTRGSSISLAGGVDVAGLSASAAAIVDGPGVLAVHLRARQLWKRPIARVSVDAALEWLDELLSTPPQREGAARRLIRRVKDWLVPRTDATALPGLGTGILLGLRDLSFHGDITCGFSDPALTGKAAACLFPLAGILAPLGLLDVQLDWSGKTRLDGAIELSFRFVPVRIARELLRFAWHHVHVSAPVSSTIPKAIAPR